jgi:anhydro-N-acetylmuramic acid kinase
MMASLVRLDASQHSEETTWIAGLWVAAQGTRAAASLVTAAGHGLAARVSVALSRQAEIPRETAAVLGRIIDDPRCPAAALPDLATDLADLGAELVGRLLAERGVPASAVMALGVYDPGLWTVEPTGSPGYMPLVDAAQLAERTALNVIDAFPAKDLAQGGLGGPLLPLAEWLLLGHPRRNRALLDLGRTVRLTYLPASRSVGPSRILAMDVGPGMLLLDGLARRLSGGRQTFDPGGRMAAQGQRIGPLLDRWLADPYFNRPLPRWHPRGVAPEPFLNAALAVAVENDWVVRDLLCTATHFIAEAIAQTLRKRLPDDAPLDEIIVTGGGAQNGMLLRQIAHRVEVPLVPCGEIAAPPEALEPASIALLAMLHLDQVPANATGATGAEAPRVLGRMTPGSPRNWQRLLQAHAASMAAVRPLRAAV